MLTLARLYAQNPGWIWLAVAALFILLNLASGRPRLVWPMLAAILVAVLDFARVPLNWPVDLAVFLVLSAVGLVVSFRVKAIARLHAESSRAESLDSGSGRTPLPPG